MALGAQVLPSNGSSGNEGSGNVNNISSLKIMSYNCRGIKNVIVGNALKQCDILLLQETWISKQNMGVLNNLSNEFYGTGVSPNDASSGIIKGRLKGGAAIMWRRCIDKYVNCNNHDLDWLTSVNLKINENDSLHIICVYLPYQCSENEDEFLGKLGILSSIINDSPIRNVIVLGDFNANIKGRVSNFGRYLDSFCTEYDLKFASKLMLPRDTHTYISDMCGSTSWLDHCLCTSAAFSIVNNLKVRHDLCSTDHIPIEITISVDDIVPIINDSKKEPKICWEKLNDSQLLEYLYGTHDALAAINIPIEAIKCSDFNCTNQDHIDEYTKFYDSIVEALLSTGDQFVEVLKKGGMVKPGWNLHVKNAHKADIDAYRDWRESGKPTSGHLYDTKKERHRDFKNAVNFIKRNEQQILNDELAHNIMSKNTKYFWKNLKKVEGVPNAISNNIEGHCGEENIASFWRTHYESVFNFGFDRYEVPIEIESNYNLGISEDEILSHICELKSNKAPGPDGLSAEHLKFSCSTLVGMLAKCISAILVHGVVPKSMTCLELVPIPKDDKGKLNDKGNYRPISLASCLSKILEMCILKRIGKYINTEINQFGYKPELGTDSCIYTLKEMIHSNLDNNTNTYLGFLDASKAFDRVHHDLLFSKLKEKGTPGFIIRILKDWYMNQSIHVRWGNSKSESFFAANGVKQGGILSPYLFNFYMNGLSEKLNKLPIGCWIGGMKVNHLSYADDIIVISSSQVGLQRLLDTCSRYSEMNHIKFNSKKSAIMFVKSEYFKELQLRECYLNGEILEEKKSVKYLGHLLTNDAKDDEDMMRHLRYLYTVGNSIIRRFYFCSRLVKLKLFKAYCMNIYTGHLWINYKQATYNKIRTAYNTILRRLLGIKRFENGVNYSASGMFATNTIPCLAALLRKLIYRFQCRVTKSSNTLLLTLGNVQRIQCRMWKFWETRLFSSVVG